MKQKTKKSIPVLLAVLLVALSMRAPMGCVGPLVGQIQQDLQINSFIAGFLTTIPLIAFAVTAPLAGKIAVRIDIRLLLQLCLIVSAAGLVLRSFCGIPGLFGGTILLGLGIGTMNVLMPALIRQQFPDRIGFVMGLYSTAMTASSAVMAGFCQNISSVLGGWKYSMASPLILTGLAVVASISASNFIVPHLKMEISTDRASKLINLRRVSIAVFMGLQSFLFFSVLTWYPSITTSRCELPVKSGQMLLMMQLFSLIPAFIIPIISQKTGRKGQLAVVSTLLLTLGFVLILISTSAVPVILGTIILGLGMGATLSLALTFVATQGKTSAETAGVSAFSQCVGYLIAAFGPTGLGYLFDSLGNWDIILGSLTILSLGMAVFGFVGEDKRTK